VTTTTRRSGAGEPPTLPIRVNARFWQRPLSGVERYGRAITSRLGARVTLCMPRRSARGLRGHLWEQFVLPRLLRSGDVLFSPANTGPLMVRSQVVTIHDLSPIEQPHWYSRGFARWYTCLLPRLATRCRRLITDSAFSKARLVELFALPDEKVVVIPLGVDPEFRPVSREASERVRRQYHLPRQYVLAMGPAGERKNVAALFAAWRLVHARFTHLGLVLVGGSDRHFRHLAAGQPPDGVHCTGWVDDSELPAIYSGASALLLTSLYEGFGLPILEAMACHVPVVASNRTAVPEVVGDAGLLVDPAAPESVAASVIRVLEDERLRAELCERGSQRVREFSWERAADQTWRVLQEAATA
jgi:glycosyltransferase involved in cell wall biosynthesis